jgi:[1-hydroxy-2-(trimethylamino)ethyl]phosphonate dioxygenase
VKVGDEVLALYGARGAGAYFGERVTMTEHGLQAAWFARNESAPETLIIAALLHDVGHLLEAVPDDLADWTTDARHEEVGARWLARRFGPEISEPVRLHVAAKRYLCATDARYCGQLSDASVHTLKLQGGPMSADETRRFESERYFREAVRVRLWDDQGKVAGLTTPPLEAYLGMLAAAVRIPAE